MAACPSCGGANARKARVISSEGTTKSSGRVTGIGVSTTGSVGVGVGNTSATHRTRLAEENSVKLSSSLLADAQMFITFFVALFVGALSSVFLADLIGSELLGGVLGLGVLVLVWFWLNTFGASKIQDDRWTDEVEEYGRTWVCTDCGHKWLEEKVSTSKILQSSQANDFEDIKPWSREQLISESEVLVKERAHFEKRSRLHDYTHFTDRLDWCDDSQLGRIERMYEQILVDLPQIYVKPSEAKTLERNIKKFGKCLADVKAHRLDSNAPKGLDPYKS